MSDERRRQPPAGWYPDPRTKGQERRWDGAAWTDEVRAPQPREFVVPASWDAEVPPPTPGPTTLPLAPGAADPFAPVGLARPAPAPPQPQPGPTPGPHPGPGVPGASTARPGARLASLGARVLATLLDLLLVQGVSSLLSLPLVLSSRALFDEMVAELQSGAPSADVLLDLAGRIPATVQLGMAGIVFLTWFVYGGLMLQRFGATLGHLAVGLRTVPAGQPDGRLSAGRAWGRSFAWSLLWTASSVPAMSLVVVLACVWMAWTPSRQTLQDVICRTQVVRRR